MTNPPQLKAQRLAAKIVAHAVRRPRQYKMTFSVTVRGGESVPIHHWRHKNSCGVTFPATETGAVAATAWITAALLAGFPVCAHWGGRLSGGGVYGLEERA
jgi:hypothetical protein